MSRTPFFEHVAIWIADVRQLGFPRELRISRPVFARDEIESLERAAHALLAAASTPAEKPRPALDGRLVAEVATGLWRARRRMTDAATGQPLAEMQRLYRQVQSIIDALERSEIHIRDHDGEPWSDGRDIEVVEFEAREDLLQEKIVETVRPSVVQGDVLVQRAQVVVGKPPAEQGRVGA